MFRNEEKVERTNLDLIISYEGRGNNEKKIGEIKEESSEGSREGGTQEVKQTMKRYSKFKETKDQ